MPGVDQQKYVPTSFKWAQKWGNHVCVAGSFDPPVPTWTPIEMQKNKDNIHEVTLDLLPDKKYFFKFVIDGNWVLDESFPSCPDSSGNWNHEIQVELPPPPPPPAEEEKEEVVIEEKPQEEIVTEEKPQEEIATEEKPQEEMEKSQEQIVTEEKPQEEMEKSQEQIAIEEKPQEEIATEEKPQEEIATEEKSQEQIVTEEKPQEEIATEEKFQEQIATEEKPQEEIATEEKSQEEIATEEKSQEEIVIEEKPQEVIVSEENQIEQQEDKAIAEEHKEELHHDHQAVTEDHQVDENKQQHQEEQVVSEDKEEQSQHQEEQVVNEDKEQHHQHQEGYQVVEELQQHHDEDDQKEQHNEDQEINTTEQSRDDNVVTSEAIETETITNAEQSELPSIVKETIIEPDNDKLSAEHVANVTDDIIIEGTHDESMTTESNETLHPPQNDTEPINVSISPVATDENVEEVTPETAQYKATEILDEFKDTEKTSSTAGEEHETVEPSTTETEVPIESSNFSTDEVKVESNEDEPENETINENEDDEKEDDYDYKNEGAEDIENNTLVGLDENLNLNEETIKEVLLNNTWAKDDSLEETIPSSWTESHESHSVIWPDNTNLKWSDINKEASDETTISEVTEITSNDVKEVLSREIPSTVLVEETNTGQAEPIAEDISAQSVVESHIEHMTKESDYETGINNKVPTSEVKELSFAQYEKPESSATADKEISIPTPVVAVPAIEQHSYLNEEIVTSQAIDNSKEDDVSKENISRKIISISPSTSSPGESTRNADMYTHVATNTSRSPNIETVNIKSKPVVEIVTSREILQKDSKNVIQQEEEEEEKIDLNDMAYLVTSVATTFTLGVISMLYKSVFRTKNQ